MLGDALPVDEAEVVLHVPAPDLSSAEEATLLANLQRQFGLLRRLREGQRSQEERALSFAGGLLEQSLELVPHAGEAVAEVVPSHADGTSRHVDELVAEVRAGGYVARRAARGAGFDHCFRRSRGGVGLCEASPPKSNICV